MNRKEHLKIGELCGLVSGAICVITRYRKKGKLEMKDLLIGGVFFESVLLHQFYLI